MDEKRKKMVALIRRHPDEIVLESGLRNSLVKEGLIAEYKTGVSCMGSGCSLCVMMVCPTCGREDRKGEVVFLVDREPYILLGDQAVLPHAPQPNRDF